MKWFLIAVFVLASNASALANDQKQDFNFKYNKAPPTTEQRLETFRPPPPLPEKPSMADRAQNATTLKGRDGTTVRPNVGYDSTTKSPTFGAAVTTK